MRIKVNTTWEEDEEERRKYFDALPYQERVRYLTYNVVKFAWVKRPTVVIGLKVGYSKLQFKAPNKYPL